MSFILSLVAVAIGAAWLRYRWVHQTRPQVPSSVELTDLPGPRPWGIHTHQLGVQWLHEIFERSASQFPDFPALTVAATGQTLSYRELNRRADEIARLISACLDREDQVVAVYMTQDHVDAVASHLAILKAGAVQLFLDPEAPSAVVQDTLDDAEPAVVLTQGHPPPCDAPYIDLTRAQPDPRDDPKQVIRSRWLDDPRHRLASIFYTSGTSGKAKGVECPHAGYINLVKSYAGYFDFIAGQDATSLSSSLGYDGSISEMYSAWVAGAEVVMLSKSELRAGPDLLPILIRREVTALFCPPVLLSTLTSDPAKELPYPICRYVIPAGEAFPASLIPAWSEGRRQIINTYGPTEVSTDTSRQMLRPGEPVTIGTPFPGVSYFILAPDGLETVPPGEEGELCIGGCQLARGYRNLETTTAEKFFEHPQFGRLYRSGDRCHIDPESGRVHFHGRIDTQLKVRGFRVETQPIESMLQDRFAEIETAVLDCQNDELVAFIQLPISETASIDTDFGPSLLQADWVEKAREMLGQSFPAYAVPSRYFSIPRFNLVAASGKIDRRALPDISSVSGPSEFLHPAVDPKESLPEDEIESKVLAICRSVLGNGLKPEDDFIEWGAHSIAIAQLSQRLQVSGYPIAVRHLLSDARSARGVAERLRKEGGDATDKSESENQSVDLSDEDYRGTFPAMNFRWFSAFQLIGALLLRLPLATTAVAAVVLSDAEALLLRGDLASFLMFSVFGFVIYLSLPFINLGWVIILRGLGHLMPNPVLRPGRYAKFSRVHLMIWWTEQQQSLVLRPIKNMIRSPRVFRWILRRLGARVSTSAHISQSVEFMGPLTFLRVADGAVIQASSQVSTVRWEGDSLFLAWLSVGDHAKVGTRATLSAGASLGARSWLTPLSSLEDATPDNVMLTGVPAAVIAGHQPLQRVRQVVGHEDCSKWREARNVGLQSLLELILIVLPMAMTALISLSLLGFGSIESVMRSSGEMLSLQMAGLMGSAIMGIWLSILLSSAMVSGFVRMTAGRAGAVGAESLRGIMARYRQQKMNQLQQFWTWSLTGQYLRALAGVRFDRVGGSECDTMTNLLPDMLDAGADVFLAHGCFCNVLDEEGEILTLRPLQVPDAYFASNNSVSENGNLPGNLLLGVSTSLGPYWARQQSRLRPDSPRVLAGNPPLGFSAAGLVARSFGALPGFPVFLMRVLFSDIGSTGAIPGLGIFFGIALLVWAETLGLGPWMSTGLAALIFFAALPVAALAIKWILVGARWGVDHAAPFWSIRHFTYFLAQDCFFQWAGIFLISAEGTALANPLLRAFGCKIGKRTVWAHPIQAFDWHAVDIGEECVINGQLQLHSFEGRVLTVRRSRIGSRTCVNHGAMLMGGADISDHVTIYPQTLVLKGMQLQTGTHQGSPSQRAEI